MGVGMKLKRRPRVTSGPKGELGVTRSLALGNSFQGIQVHGLGALNGQAHLPGPHQVRNAANRSGYSEDRGVVVFLSEAVVLHAGAREGIDIGPRVLHLASGLEHWGNGLVADVGQLEELVLREVLLGEVAEDHIARVGLSEHSVAESGNHLARGQGVLGVLSENVHSRFLTAQVLLGLLQPPQALLVCEAVQGSCETADASSIGVVRVAQSTANQVGCVGGHVAALVVSVQH
mmetsp:Transcript_35872/g.53550  ORF Transcript_35872/g.53550 Transcript_35872/m.53550 type:complete len:233 (+) Transcript_35872:179-877(+)